MDIGRFGELKWRDRKLVRLKTDMNYKAGGEQPKIEYVTLY